MLATTTAITDAQLCGLGPRPSSSLSLSRNLSSTLWWFSKVCAAFALGRRLQPATWAAASWASMLCMRVCMCACASCLLPMTRNMIAQPCTCKTMAIATVFCGVGCLGVIWAGITLGQERQKLTMFGNAVDHNRCT